MIGFSLKISELKEEPSKELLEEIEALSERGLGERLREALQGRIVSGGHTILHWTRMGRLMRAVGPRRNGERVLLQGGYPILLIARGDTILLTVAQPRTELHNLLLRALEPESFYLVESWDLS